MKDKYYLQQEQIEWRNTPKLATGYCRHCNNLVIEKTEWDRYDKDTTYYCTCDNAKKVASVRKKIYSLQTEIKVLEKDLQQSLNFEHEEVLERRLQWKMNKFIEGVSGDERISIEELREIFKLGGEVFENK